MTDRKGLATDGGGATRGRGRGPALAPAPAGGQNPLGPSSAAQHVVRGASWSTASDDKLRSDWREAGAAQAEIEALSHVVSAMWAGLFKGAGFAFVGRTERIGEADVHIMQIGRGAAARTRRGAEHADLV